MKKRKVRQPAQLDRRYLGKALAVEEGTEERTLGSTLPLRTLQLKWQEDPIHRSRPLD